MVSGNHVDVVVSKPKLRQECAPRNCYLHRFTGHQEERGTAETQITSVEQHSQECLLIHERGIWGAQTCLKSFVSLLS